ncbi:MAG: DNA polymerase III subunit delta' [Omnitrophica WOR_2 bacterium GWA2_47_8]|nr:MAG: DNA polymerase III subunit delta' [Omnitrophica WOR_2 bacterium GWA2_47_8]
MASLLINEEIIGRFIQLLNNKHLAHAYLLVGVPGVGKLETAQALAKSVNCEKNSPSFKEGCETCPSCLKINSGNHPDVQIVQCEYGETIKIEDIRRVITQLQLRSFEARRKVVIIRNIENLTLEAGNALLKTLEEPTKDSLLLLTSASPEKILDTVKSRCHRIYFPGAPQERVVSLLLNEYHIEESEGRILSFFAQGSFGKAEALNKAKFFQKKNEAIDAFLFSVNTESYIGKILAEKSKTKEALDVLLSWFRDVVLLKKGMEEKRLVNRDRLKDLLRIQDKYSLDDLNGIIGQIIYSMQLLSDNLNVKIALNLLKEKIR